MVFTGKFTHDRRRPTRVFRALWLLFATVWLGAPAAAQEQNAPPRLTTTVRPLQMIAEEITRGVLEPELVVPAAQSPHFFSLTPSAAIALNTADVIVWIGEELETFLAQTIEGLSDRAEIIEALEVQGVQTLPYGESHPGHGGHGGGADPHLWLSTRNAAAVAEELASVLSRADPANADIYADNLSAFRERLAALEPRLQSLFSGLENRPFIVYHNAFQYFEAQAGIAHRFVLLRNEERQPGIRRIMAVREAVAEIRPVCLLTEASASETTIDAMLGNHELRQTAVDVLGVELPPGEGNYFMLMERVAEAVRSCLQG